MQSQADLFSAFSKEKKTGGKNWEGFSRVGGWGVEGRMWGGGGWRERGATEFPDVCSHSRFSGAPKPRKHQGLGPKPPRVPAEFGAVGSANLASRREREGIHHWVRDPDEATLHIYRGYPRPPPPPPPRSSFVFSLPPAPLGPLPTPSPYLRPPSLAPARGLQCAAVAQISSCILTCCWRGVTSLPPCARPLNSFCQGRVFLLSLIHI